ncbi:hypothetical protein CAPTEDRAFT_200075, partial [Capitella teleta]
MSRIQIVHLLNQPWCAACCHGHGEKFLQHADAGPFEGPGRDAVLCSVASQTLVLQASLYGGKKSPKNAPRCRLIAQGIELIVDFNQELRASGLLVVITGP